MKRNSPEDDTVQCRKFPMTPRCIWTKQEDNLLTELATRYKGKKWRLIAEAISDLDILHKRHKTAKQCRERWHSHLNPNIVDAPWTVEEQVQLMEAHKIVGNKWSVIAERLIGRTDNSVKNFFFCKLRKLARNIRNQILEVGVSSIKEEVEQTAYLLNHLYKFYMGPERDINMAKEDGPGATSRKGLGDKYIIDVLSKGEFTHDVFDKYVKGFFNVLPVEISQRILQNYPELSKPSHAETEVKLPSMTSLRAPCNSLIFVEFKLT